MALLHLPVPSFLVAAGLTVARMGLAVMVALQRHFSERCFAPTWKNLVQCAQESDSLDAVLDAHELHLKTLLQGLLLTVNHNVTDALDVVLDTCEAFSNFTMRLVEAGASDPTATLRQKQFHAKAMQMQSLLQAATTALAQQIERTAEGSVVGELVGDLSGVFQNNGQ